MLNHWLRPQLSADPTPSHSNEIQVFLPLGIDCGRAPVRASDTGQCLLRRSEDYYRLDSPRIRCRKFGRRRSRPKRLANGITGL